MKLNHEAGSEAGGASKRLMLTVVALLCMGSLSCQSKDASQGQRYELKGQVVSVDRANRTVTISHEEIRGLMESMTMPFSLKDEWPLGVLAPGDQINATLVVDGSSFWLEDVVISRSSPEQSASSDTGSIFEPKPGDEVPAFSLVNQDGKRIHLQQYRGRALLLTFIYTRCPLPEYCTRMSNNFAEVDEELRKNPALYARTHLLSVSIDPDYDTPKVLRSYGAAHTQRYDRETFEHWEFATGMQEEVRRMAQFFGLSYFPANDQIEHALRTAIITPGGKIFKIYRGNEWQPAEVVRDLGSLFDEDQR